MTSPLLVLDILFAALGLYLFRLLLTSRNAANTTSLPGPPGLPFVGNILDMPTSYEHLTFAKWSERWGIVLRRLTVKISLISTHTY